MLDSLRNIGISESEYKELIEENSLIENLEPMDVEDMIMLLKSLNCSDEHIKNIILSDVFYLTRTKNDVQKLLIELYDRGISTDDLTELIQNYPYILEKDDFEISEFFNKNHYTRNRLRLFFCQFLLLFNRLVNNAYFRQFRKLIIVIQLPVITL